MSQKAIREYDGKLMLSKYLAANSGQQHTHSAAPRSRRDTQQQAPGQRGEVTDVRHCSRAPHSTTISTAYRLVLDPGRR